MIFGSLDIDTILYKHRNVYVLSEVVWNSRPFWVAQRLVCLHISCTRSNNVAERSNMVNGLVFWATFQNTFVSYTPLWAFRNLVFSPILICHLLAFFLEVAHHLTVAYCLRPHQVPKLHGHFPQCLCNLYPLAALQRWILYQDLLKYLRLTFVITSNFFKTWKDLITSNFTIIANVFFCY